MTTLASGRFAIFTGTQVLALGQHVDGYSAEEHEVAVTPTSYPVETGVSLTDHAVREPIKLKLHGWVSDLMPARRLGQVYLDLADRGAAAWLAIVRATDRRRPLRVVTSLASYENMLITKASAGVNDRTGLGLQFVLELQEILISSVTEAADTDAASAGGPARDRLGVSSRGRVLPLPHPTPAQALRELSRISRTTA